MRRTWAPCLALSYVLATAASAQVHQGLKWNFRARQIDYAARWQDLQGAYQVDRAGQLRLLPNPELSPGRQSKLAVKFLDAQGTVSITLGDDTVEAAIRPDNAWSGPRRPSSTPFGYQLLPASGKAAPGDSWTQAMPGPTPAKVKADVTYRYTYSGAKSVPGCGDCRLIEILGLRRLTGGAFDKAYSAEQAFALGDALFDAKAGVLHSFTLSANPSMLTALPVPGMMRRVTFERGQGR
ncbi:MAG: hypothetical protein HZB13_11555 [Acidobacteria bacterium]|nr:hypothetical protein [Acidobacteriota bacterium]